MRYRFALWLRRAAGWALALLFWRPGRRRLVAALPSAKRVVLLRIDNRVGEALLVTPLVAALQGRYAVELVLHPRCVRVLEGLPGVSAIHPFQRGWLPFGAGVRALRALTEGAVVVNCASWKEYSSTAAIVSRLISPRACVIGPSVAPASALMDVAVVPRGDTPSELLQRLHYLTPLLGEVPRAPMAFRAPRSTEAVRRLRQTVRAPFAVVNPGGRLDERRLPKEVFIAACARLLELGVTPLVTWGPGEEPLASAIVVAAPGSVLAPATTLDELAFLMQGARAVVCNNTGPMHLAVAVGAPTLALFFRMPVERWGHASSPHRMVDLTTAVDPARTVREELTAFLPTQAALASVRA